MLVELSEEQTAQGSWGRRRRRRRMECSSSHLDVQLLVPHTQHEHSEHSNSKTFPLTSGDSCSWAVLERQERIWAHCSAWTISGVPQQCHSVLHHRNIKLPNTATASGTNSRQHFWTPVQDREICTQKWELGNLISSAAWGKHSLAAATGSTLNLKRDPKNFLWTWQQLRGTSKNCRAHSKLLLLSPKQPWLQPCPGHSHSHWWGEISEQQLRSSLIWVGFHRAQQHSSTKQRFPEKLPRKAEDVSTSPHPKVGVKHLMHYPI